VNCTQTRAGKNGNKGFRNHRHINQHAVTFADATIFQHPGKECDAFQQLSVTDGFRAVCDRAVVNNRCLFGTTVFNVMIYSVVTGIEFTIRKPACKWRLAVISGSAMECWYKLSKSPMRQVLRR